MSRMATLDFDAPRPIACGDYVGTERVRTFRKPCGHTTTVAYTSALLTPCEVERLRQAVVSRRRPTTPATRRDDPPPHAEVEEEDGGDDDAADPFNTTGPDSVDGRPAFESFVVNRGAVLRPRVWEIAREAVEARLAPLVRRRFGAPGATLCQMLVRR